jgi:hypothetical protein
VLLSWHAGEYVIDALVACAWEYSGVLRLTGSAGRLQSLALAGDARISALVDSASQQVLKRCAGRLTDLASLEIARAELFLALRRPACANVLLSSAGPLEIDRAAAVLGNEWAVLALGALHGSMDDRARRRLAGEIEGSSVALIRGLAMLVEDGDGPLSERFRSALADKAATVRTQAWLWLAETQATLHGSAPVIPDLSLAHEESPEAAAAGAHAIRRHPKSLSVAHALEWLRAVNPEARSVAWWHLGVSGGSPILEHEDWVRGIRDDDPRVRTSCATALLSLGLAAQDRGARQVMSSLPPVEWVSELSPESAGAWLFPGVELVASADVRGALARHVLDAIGVFRLGPALVSGLAANLPSSPEILDQIVEAVSNPLTRDDALLLLISSRGPLRPRDREVIQGAVGVLDPHVRGAALLGLSHGGQLPVEHVAPVGDLLVLGESLVRRLAMEALLGAGTPGRDALRARLTLLPVSMAVDAAHRMAARGDVVPDLREIVVRGLDSDDAVASALLLTSLESVQLNQDSERLGAFLRSHDPDIQSYVLDALAEQVTLNESLAPEIGQQLSSEDSETREFFELLMARISPQAAAQAALRPLVRNRNPIGMLSAARVWLALVDEPRESWTEEDLAALAEHPHGAEYAGALRAIQTRDLEALQSLQRSDDLVVSVAAAGALGFATAEADSIIVRALEGGSDLAWTILVRSLIARRVETSRWQGGILRYLSTRGAPSIALAIQALSTSPDGEARATQAINGMLESRHWRVVVLGMEIMKARRHLLAVGRDRLHALSEHPVERIRVLAAELLGG